MAFLIKSQQNLPISNQLAYQNFSGYKIRYMNSQNEDAISEIEPNFIFI